jgi:hypothetical protein
MKTLRQLSVALVFTLALIIPAFAGDIQTTVTAPPPPPPSTSSTAPGDISTGVAGEISTMISEEATTASMTETALNLLQSVLSLF